MKHSFSSRKVFSLKVGAEILNANGRKKCWDMAIHIRFKIFGKRAEKSANLVKNTENL
jgi:hypothetical protein